MKGFAAAISIVLSTIASYFLFQYSVGKLESYKLLILIEFIGICHCQCVLCRITCANMASMAGMQPNEIRKG